MRRQVAVGLLISLWVLYLLSAGASRTETPRVPSASGATGTATTAPQSSPKAADLSVLPQR
jgi:hypothetical protein